MPRNPRQVRVHEAATKALFDSANGAMAWPVTQRILCLASAKISAKAGSSPVAGSQNPRCIQAKKFKATTNSNHSLPVKENLLGQSFEPVKPNEMWVSDISYIPTAEGWLYLAGIKDVFTCEIVGYAMGSRMTKELVSAALTLALAQKRPKEGLILHSDRGSQYCSHDYQRQVALAGLLGSMSRKGNCYDNAPMESFWGSLKNELVHHRSYKTRVDAQEEITEYIEIFYNRIRRHSRLNDEAPAVFAKQFELANQE